MDAVKKPEFMAAVVAVIAVVGVAVYYYRKDVETQKKIDNIQDYLKSTVKKIAELPYGGQIKQLTDKYNEYETKGRTIDSRLMDIENMLEKIIEHLEQKDGFKIKKKKKKSKKRHDSDESSTEEDNLKDIVASVNKKSVNV